MKQSMKYRVVGPMFVLAVAIATANPSVAEVRAYSDETRPNGPVVVLEINRITDDGTPQLWEPQPSAESSRVQVLNPLGQANLDGRPSIVVHPGTRVPWAAWALRTATGYDVVASRFTDGSWSAPIVVAASTVSEIDETEVSLVADPLDGTLHVFYTVDAASSRVEHRWSTADGLDWSPPDVVSAGGEHGRRPAATFHAGRLLVTYESDVATARQIVVAEHGPAGWSRGVVADTFHEQASRPQIHSDGTRLWVDWIDQAGAMRWTFRQSGGSWTQLNTEPFADAEDLEYHVRGRVRRAVREQP